MIGTQVTLFGRLDGAEFVAPPSGPVSLIYTIIARNLERL